MMDAINEPGVQRVVFMTSAQVGKTEILNNILGFHIDQDPAPCLVLQPSLEMAETWSKDRLAPMLRDSPALAGKVADPRARDSGNTTLSKRFLGGHVTVVGANSAAGLASRPIRIVLADEVDRYPASAGSEGDPLSLATKRTTTFWNRRVIVCSTPTVKGFSRIEAEWLKSDQRRYFVGCPHCAHEQTLVWAQVLWPEGRPGEARYHCTDCGVGWSDAERRAAIRWGKWRKTNPDSRIAGFHLNELYSPWSDPATMALAFVEAKGNPETLKTWVNTALGETFNEGGDGLESHVLKQRAEAWPADPLCSYDPPAPLAPGRVLVVTAGVDVQDDRLEVERVGWAEGEESWSLEYRILYGDPSAPELWAELDDYLKLPSRTQDGRLLEIRATAIDSGGHHTQRVYDFVRTRARRRIWAIKGMGGPARPVWPRKASRNNKGNVNLYLVGVDAAKDVLYKRLRIEAPGPGYCHFPSPRENDWFEQLTSERVATRFVKGRPVREWTKPANVRNEALDVRNYAYAAFLSLAIVWARELRKAAEAPRMVWESPKPAEPAAAPQAPAAARPEPGALPAAAERQPAHAKPRQSVFSRAVRRSAFLK